MIAPTQKITELKDLLAAEKKRSNALEKELEQYKAQTRYKASKAGALTEKAPGRFSGLVDAYLRMDLNGNVLEMNESAYRLFEADKGKLPFNVTALIHPDHHQYAMESYGNLIEKGKFADFASRIITLKKKTKYVQINANLIYDHLNKPFAAEGIIRDITVGKHSWDLLSAQNKEFSYIFEHSPLGIVLSAESHIKKSNKAFENMLGYTLEEQKELEPEDLFFPSMLPKVKEMQADMEAQQKSQIQLESFLRRKDGTFMKARINSTNILAKNGKIKHQIAIVEDITTLAMQTNIIEEQKKQLDIIVDNSPMGIALYERGRFSKTNRAFQKLTGYSEEELSNMTFEHITHKEDQDSTMSHYRKIHEGKLDKLTMQKRYLKKNGELVMARTSVSAVKDSEANVLYQVVMVEDVTEQVRVEAQKEALLDTLEESNTQLREYAHIVSHDLKSPLRSIFTLVSWMKEDCKDKIDESTENNLTLIQSTVENMEALINGILAYSEINTAKFASSSVCVEEIVRNAIDMLLIPPHIEVEIKSPLPLIVGSPVQLGQLFQNLLSNAVKYSDKLDGKVSVDYVEDPNYWIFKVEDNGIGISDKYFLKIFGLFQSLHSEDEYRSTGIGLAIVNRIVELHKGKIEVASKEGEGSTFTVYLKKPKDTFV
jgi:PAS domain S-box-containing protein